MTSRKDIERIKNLGLRKSYIIRDTIAELQRALHLTNGQMNNRFPDLMKALELENRDNMQRTHIMVQVKVIHKFKY